MPDTEAGYELQVYIDGNEWYPSTRLHALGNWSIALKAGMHPLKVVFLDYRTDAAQYWNLPGLNDYIWIGVAPDLRISGPGIDKQPIPEDWLTH